MHVHMHPLWCTTCLVAAQLTVEAKEVLLITTAASYQALDLLLPVGD